MRQGFEAESGQAAWIELDPDFMDIRFGIGALHQDRVIVQQFEINAIGDLSHD